MTEIKTSTHPQTKVPITFSDSDHSYTDALGNTYTSVTTLVAKYFNEFPADEMAERVAKRECKTKFEILAQWKAKADAACDYGTRVHENCERQLLGRPDLHQPRNAKEKTAFFCAWSAVRKLISVWKFVEAEKLVFSPVYLIAGQIDLLMSDDGTLYVLDWKTNEKIDRSSKYGNKGTGIIAHLDDCKLVRYSLQLWIYATLLRMEGYVFRDKPVKCALMHIPPMSYKPEFIPCLDLEKEAKAILRHHLGVVAGNAHEYTAHTLKPVGHAGCDILEAYFETLNDTECAWIEQRAETIHKREPSWGCGRKFDAAIMDFLMVKTADHAPRGRRLQFYIQQFCKTVTDPTTGETVQ